MPLFFHSSAHPSTNAAHPAFERVLKGERATRDATLALLERYGGPAGMKRAGIEDVKDWARSNGLRAGRIIDDMFKAIGEQTVTVPGTGMAETIIPSIARDIKAIKDRRREIGTQVEALLEDHPLLTVLTSMPGIGVRTASNILLGIGGDIANFKSAAHLAAYAGIAPVTGQSGTGIKGERPSGRGNKRLKNALWQSSFVASTKHPPSIAYYQAQTRAGQAPQRRRHPPRPPTLRRDLQHAQKRRPLPGTSPRSLNRATRERTPDATGRAKRAHDSQPESRHVNSPRS